MDPNPKIGFDGSQSAEYSPGMGCIRAAVMRAILLGSYILLIPSGLCQSNLPSMADIKIKAENGDREAQDELARVYNSHLNFSAAAEWSRKAAESGVLDSQERLGRILLEGRPKVAEGSVEVPQDKSAGIRWLTIAANQGHNDAQLDLGNCYEQGKGVTQDNVEAYKWFKLASAKHSVIEKIDLNRLILKMTPEQIADGQRRANAFVPHRPSEKEMPEPQYVKDVVLKGILGTPNRRLAMINNQTVGKGEEAKVKVGDRLVSVKVVEIREKSAVVIIEGLSHPREISLKQ